MRAAPKSFNKEPPRAGYVAGLGRGATAFVTSAQSGLVIAGDASAYPVANFGSAPSGYVAGAGRGIGGFGEKKPEKGAGPADAGAGRFDPLLGFSESLFGSGDYGADDQYADAVYAQVDEARQSAKQRKQAQAVKQKSIADDFADLKKPLLDVSAEAWSTLPEARAGGVKHRRTEKYTPLSDTLIADIARREAVGGVASAAAADNRKSEDLRRLSQARDLHLRVNLDRASDNVQGQSVVDPRGVLTALGEQSMGAGDVNDVKKARLLLKSVTTTNPSHGPGWIAAARLEEVDGKLIAAREIIQRACEACPQQEDVWLEAARLNDVTTAKSMLAKAVMRHLPQSVALWLQAAELEISEEELRERGLGRKETLGEWIASSDLQAPAASRGALDDEVAKRLKRRKLVLLRALEKVPDSAKLWSQAFRIETDDAEAKVILARAIACVSSVDFWISLARLETFENAQKVLNDARKKFPGEPRVWLAAAMLLEEKGDDAGVQRVAVKSVKAVEKDAVIDRTAWIAKAEDAEAKGYPKVAEAVMQAALGLGVDPEDMMRTWTNDAEAIEARGRVTCARAAHKLILTTFPDAEDAWVAWAAFERRKGGDVAGVFRQAVRACTQSLLLWLMLAKDVWLGGDLDGARRVLDEAFGVLHMSNADDGEELWLAAAKLANEVSADEARGILAKARERCPTERVWMKSIVLERCYAPAESREGALLSEAIALFPKSPKLAMMDGQHVEFATGDVAKALACYERGLERVPKSVPLYLLKVDCEERLKGAVFARPSLEKARRTYADSVEVWLASIRLEVRAGEAAVAENLVARALKQFPDSGALWAEYVDMAAPNLRKSRSEDAYKKFDKDARVVLAIGRMWWKEHQVAKAKKWMERAAALDPKLGDAWAWLLELCRAEEDGKEKQAIVARCVAAEPQRGEVWIAVRKARGNERLGVGEVLALAADKLRNAPKTKPA